MALRRRFLAPWIDKAAGNGGPAMLARSRMCTTTAPDQEESAEAKQPDAAGDDGRPPELVFAGAMFNSSANWMLRAAVEKFCAILEGKKRIDRLNLKYLRMSGQRRAVEGKREYPLILEKLSRVGKKPIEVPKGVTVKIDGQYVEVTGPQGTLSRTFRPEVGIKMEGNTIYVTQAMETKKSRAFHGLSRTLVSNMVAGVNEAFEKRLQMIGVGYRAVVENNVLVLSVGFNHPVCMPIPDGLSVKVEENTKISVKGRDNVLVGNFAANIRQHRKPEPYKGKGIRYEGEVVRKKQVKGGRKK